MSVPITMGNFIFCPLMQTSILGNTCLECDFIQKDNEVHYCCYVQEGKNPDIVIKDLILVLLNLMEEGKTSLSSSELKFILNLD